jgi:hypothetical protein
MTTAPGTKFREYAKQLVADWPPLTTSQRHQLTVLLRPAQPTAEQERSAQRKAA